MADNMTKTWTRLPVWLLPAVLAPLFGSNTASAQVNFGNETIAHRTYVADIAITPRILPEATGGNSVYTYTLPNLPAGLRFTAATRMLLGTPSTPTAVAAYTYTATSGGNNASLTFRIAVIPANANTNGFIVSNLDGGEGEVSQNNFPISVAFVTGANAGDYTMTGAVIRLSTSTVSSVSVVTDADTLVGTLAGPTSAFVAGSALTYTSTVGIPLASLTTYYLVINRDTTNMRVAIRTTNSSNQSYDGWDIGRALYALFSGQFSRIDLGRYPYLSIAAFPADVTPSTKLRLRVFLEGPLQ